MAGALDLAGVAASFGFTQPPKVTLLLKANSKQDSGRRDGGKRGGGGGKGRGASGHGFSADNPYGKRESGDKRQMVRG